MKVKFVNGVVKNCAAPTEQKMYRSGLEPTWVLALRLIGETTSSEMDNLITEENVVSLEFFTETEDGKVETLFTLSGYAKCSSSVIRHAEDIESTIAEIQLTKGL